MENQNSENPRSAPFRGNRIFSSFDFRVSIFVCLLLGGCAAPGEPVERKPVAPAAIADLAVRQLGNDVILTFTLPKKTAEQRPLKQTPSN
jgi:hypothetical protein